MIDSDPKAGLHHAGADPRRSTSLWDGEPVSGPKAHFFFAATCAASIRFVASTSTSG